MLGLLILMWGACNEDTSQTSSSRQRRSAAQAKDQDSTRRCDDPGLRLAPHAEDHLFLDCPPAKVSAGPAAGQGPAPSLSTPARAPAPTPNAPSAPSPVAPALAAPTPGTSVSPATGTPSNIVEFRIPAGTGDKAWNTEATPVIVKIGQVLRLINDDTVRHQLHTSGAPCGHQPGALATKQSFDCKVEKPVALDAGKKPFTYDHLNPDKGYFYVKTVP